VVYLGEAVEGPVGDGEPFQRGKIQASGGRVNVVQPLHRGLRTRRAQLLSGLAHPVGGRVPVRLAQPPDAGEGVRVVRNAHLPTARGE
jgi:hypothetical protein